MKHRRRLSMAIRGFDALHNRVSHAAVLFAVAVLLAAGSPSFAQVRITPDPQVLQLAAAPEPLPVQTMIRGALYLSGVSQAQIPAFSTHINDLIGQARRALSGYTDDYSLGEALLAYLHKNVFSSYVKRQTLVNVVFTTGQFNCVSSAVVYAIFGEALGLTVSGVATTDHAFCVVHTPQGNVDVETTNLYGFDPGRREEFKNSFGKITGYAYVPAGNYALRTDLDLKGLLSLILQNRLSDLETQRRFDAAVPLAVDRYALLSTPAALKDMVAEFINYASLLNDQKRYSDALSFLEHTRKQYGDSSRYAPMLETLVFNQIGNLVNQAKYDQAASVLDSKVAHSYLSPKNAQQLGALITRNLLARDLSKLSLADAMKLLDSFHNEGKITDQAYRSYVVSLYGKEGNALESAGKHLEAAALIGQAISLIGPDPRLQRARDAYLYNFAAQAHNRFAQLYNSGDYRGGLTVIRNALAAVPDSKLLQNDLAAVQSALRKSQ